ncbi:hypothetical protein TorRG33x02_006190 [Trema orientale]|uniref:Uncharacterized protein n=1 Tax=Trema orientale TaxID=63057 RepID=A0A2P5G049_TREOI|nr:hypothetical protein TorRG33x02_006190 [Trema orientale]
MPQESSKSCPYGDCWSSMTRSSLLLSTTCNYAKPARIAIEMMTFSHTWVRIRAVMVTTPSTANTKRLSTTVLARMKGSLLEK